jgi:type II secretory pathway pseudopilin PulG
VLVVVTIIAVAGAVVVPQMLNSGSLRVQAAARNVIADLLYAQNDAVGTQAPRSVVFDVPDNNYQVVDSAGNTLSVSWKAGPAGTANYMVDFANDNRFSGVALLAVNIGGGNSVQYDALGSPANGGTIDLVSGTTQYRITVAPITGRVTLAPLP